mmetsp:Transcript_21159/g.40400  ORF Transcript_21159/g.40400 Transcript_21159/m.40400 type:complete len:193 (+) Transcript_21159:1890-2468(+)
MVIGSTCQCLMQVKFFSSTQHLKALAAGEVWVIVGWSPELISAAIKSTNIGLVVPSSGTSLWSDMWIVPASRYSGKSPSPLLSQWLDFNLQERRLPKHRGLKGGVSPLHFPFDMDLAQGRDSGVRSSARMDLQPRESVFFGSFNGNPQQGTSTGILEGAMPSVEVMNHSEFILPLTHRATSQCQLLLKDLRQ